jgi:membrane-bound lytic murein transglycosylase A
VRLRWSPDTRLTPVALDTLRDFRSEGLLNAWRVYDRGMLALRAGLSPLRKAAPFPRALLESCEAVHRNCDSDQAAGRFFVEAFQAYRIGGESEAFYTGYHEPECLGSLTRTSAFREPLLAPPPNLEILSPETSPWGAGITSGLRQGGGSLVAPPVRWEIERSLDRFEAVAWVADPIEAFRIHVQGSARIRLPDGSVVRLTYAGRNGRPYTSIAKILLSQGRLHEQDMSAEAAYAWIRAHGLGADDLGRSILQRNESFIFFRRNHDLAEEAGPVGGASIPLSPRRSIAVDRTIWPYGLPFWIDCAGPGAGQTFSTMTIAQDTGSAIVGPARADVFMGWGEQAAQSASSLRRAGQMTVLLPKAGLAAAVACDP